jgi:hypothetical protein
MAVLAPMGGKDVKGVVIRRQVCFEFLLSS